MQPVVKCNQLKSAAAPVIRGAQMSLTLHFHPLASFCWKALIALYENDTPFTPNMVNLGDEAERAAPLKLWPIGKFPVLRDDARNQTIPESSIMIEYLDRYYPGRTRFIPGEDLAWQTPLVRAILRSLCPSADAKEGR
jgi:glutathione S-transferase